MPELVNLLLHKIKITKKQLQNKKSCSCKYLFTKRLAYYTWNTPSFHSLTTGA